MICHVINIFSKRRGGCPVRYGVYLEEEMVQRGGSLFTRGLDPLIPYKYIYNIQALLIEEGWIQRSSFPCLWLAILGHI